MPFKKVMRQTLWLIASAASLPLCNAQYSDLNVYSFILTGDTMTLDGCDTTACSLEEGGDVSETDQFGNLAMYADRQGGNPSNSCWPDGRYCTSQYLVEKGEIDDGSGNIIEAFTINQPSESATQFVASKTQLMFKVISPTSESYTVFQYVAGKNGGPASFIELEEFTAKDGVFVSTDIAVNSLLEAKTYFIAPSDNKPSIYPNPPQGTTTQKVHIFTEVLNSDTQVALYADLLDVSPKSPFQPSVDWDEGPNNHNHKYGFRRTFTRALKEGGLEEGVVWQDQNDWKIYVTWIMDDGHNTIELPNPAEHYLVAAASDGGVNGQIIYMTFDRTDAGDKVTPLDVIGRRVDSTGAVLQETQFDTDKGGGLNVYKYFSSGSSLHWDVESSTLGWMISRLMLQSSDSLNHQSCIFTIIDADTLEVVANRGQTSSHSWNNYVAYNSDESRYLAVDLGDNFPRGVHVHNIPVEGSISRKVVYTFKTKHGTSATSPAGATYPMYEEISTSTNTFYQWSNDNAVYTEIAHPPTFLRDDGSILVLFSGERPPLDNGLAIRNSNAPRNIGLVIVSGDLQTILSEGEDSTGGFYNFGGGWKDQTNEGIVWLTDFTPDTNDFEEFENAIRIKTAVVNTNQIFIVYENWAADFYVNTGMMLIDLDGNIIAEPVTMPFEVRLSPTDEPIVTDVGDIVFYSTDETGAKLVRYHFVVGEVTTPSPAPTVSSGGGGDPPADDDSPVQQITNLIESITALFAVCLGLF